MEYTIRPVRAEELEQVAAVEAECFPAAEAASREDFEKRLETCAESFFVAETKKGEILGFVNGCCSNDSHLADVLYHDSSLHDPQGAYQMIFGLNVRPAYRRQGIGEALMRHMIESARKRGKKAVVLTCKEHMVTFYSRLGYRFFGLSDSTHGGASWYLMRYEFDREPMWLEHRVAYYETDQMGIVHHSNYIRWFEEARVDLMEKLGMGYEQMEAEGIISPVLGVQASYRSMTRFGDTVLVYPSVIKYNGIRLEISYRVTDRDSGALRCEGESQHCFLNADGRPVSLKRANPGAHEMFMKLLEENTKEKTSS